MIREVLEERQHHQRLPLLPSRFSPLSCAGGLPFRTRFFRLSPPSSDEELDDDDEDDDDEELEDEDDEEEDEEEEDDERDLRRFFLSLLRALDLLERRLACFSLRASLRRSRKKARFSDALIAFSMAIAASSVSPAPPPLPASPSSSTRQEGTHTTGGGSDSLPSGLQ